jgi:hypothetical protein
MFLVVEVVVVQLEKLLQHLNQGMEERELAQPLQVNEFFMLAVAVAV